MTEEQIKNWIEDEVKRNPQLAEKYKKQRLLRLQTELKTCERRFNREGYVSYRDPGFSKHIVELRDEIQEVEKIPAESLLIDRMVAKYPKAIALKDKEIREEIQTIKNLTNEDHYVAGVFNNTPDCCIQGFCIRNQKTIEEMAQLAKKDKEWEKGYKEFTEIYQKGLAKRDQFIEEGEKYHSELLARKETELLENLDVSKKIQDVINDEVEDNKFYCRDLASLSVVDAFDQMGSHPSKKETEKIDKIIELHDPSVVESVIKRMSENPTENMLALMRNIEEAPDQSQVRKKLKLMGASGILLGVASAALIALGGVFVAEGNYIPGIGAMGGLGFSRAIATMFKYKGTKNLNKLHTDAKDDLMSRCIDDLLDEVVYEETYNKGLEK